MIRPIAIYPDPVLYTPSVDVGDEDITTLVRDMCDTLEACQTGAALAAVQIGIPKRLFVMKTDKTKPHRVFKNLRITNLGENKQVFKEGCLSMPGVFEDVERRTEVTVEYDEAGAKKVETFTGFEAFVMQHEAQHMDGYTISDTMDKAGRKKILNKMKKWIAKGIYYPMGSNPHQRLWTPQDVDFDALRRLVSR